MPELIFIGNGRKTHLRADGSGIVREGRSRCEVTDDGKEWIYRAVDGSVSPSRPAPPGAPTCHWCRNRRLLG